MPLLEDILELAAEALKRSDQADSSLFSNDWQTVTSSNVDAFKYDRLTQELQVRFTSGRVYSYTCDPLVVVGLAHASSPGGYVHRAIIPLGGTRIA